MSSGRGVISKKDTVDDARVLDILGIAKAKVFQKHEDFLWTSSWERHGKVTASISYRLIRRAGEPSALRFMYTLRNRWSDEEKRDLDYQVSLSSTRCHLGGVRWWFLCPLVRSGRPCLRRARILYLPYGANYFGCRECYELTYESRQMHRSVGYELFQRPMRMMERADKIMKRARSAKSIQRALWLYEESGRLMDGLSQTVDRLKNQMRIGKKYSL